MHVDRADGSSHVCECCAKALLILFATLESASCNLYPPEI